MAESVIHFLEVVQIEKQYGHHGIVSGRLAYSHVKTIIGQSQRGQSRQRIMIRHVAYLLFHLFAFGNIPGNLSSRRYVTMEGGKSLKA
jgi:hypothetical protein